LGLKSFGQSLAIVGGMKKTMTTQNQHSRTHKKKRVNPNLKEGRVYQTPVLLL